MKLIVALLSFCVLTTCASAQQAPLCDLFSYVSNETWFSQAIMGVVQQNYRPLECLGGCALYTVNSTFGGLLKSKIGVPYSFFETCLRKGVRTHDTCEIADCVLDLAFNGVKLANSLDLKIPYLPMVEQMLKMLMNQPHIVLMDEQTPLAPQVAVAPSNLFQQAPQKTQEPQPTRSKEEMHPATMKPTEAAAQKVQQDHPVEAHTEKVNSASNMIPTFGLLHICGFLLFLKNAY